jgi:hypothetical protein
VSDIPKTVRDYLTSLLAEFEQRRRDDLVNKMAEDPWSMRLIWRIYGAAAKIKEPRDERGE